MRYLAALAVPLAILAGCGSDQASEEEIKQAVKEAIREERESAMNDLVLSRITAQTRAAATTLKSAIFTGQVQFAAGAYMDCDQDGRGEYATLGQMAGSGTYYSGDRRNESLEGELTLLGEAYRDENNAGFNYVVYLPTAEGWANSDAYVADQEAADAREKYFIAYAYPESPEDGSHTFMITQDGVVRAIGDNSGTKPEWWAAFAESEPADPRDWTIARRPVWQSYVK